MHALLLETERARAAWEGRRVAGVVGRVRRPLKATGGGPRATRTRDRVTAFCAAQMKEGRMHARTQELDHSRRWQHKSTTTKIRTDMDIWRQ